MDDRIEKGRRPQFASREQSFRVTNVRRDMNSPDCHIDCLVDQLEDLRNNVASHGVEPLVHTRNHRQAYSCSVASLLSSDATAGMTSFDTNDPTLRPRSAAFHDEMAEAAFRAHVITNSISNTCSERSLEIGKIWWALPENFLKAQATSTKTHHHGEDSTVLDGPVEQHLHDALPTQGLSRLDLHERSNHSFDSKQRSTMDADCLDTSQPRLDTLEVGTQQQSLLSVALTAHEKKSDLSANETSTIIYAHENPSAVDMVSLAAELPQWSYSSTVFQRAMQRLGAVFQSVSDAIRSAAGSSGAPANSSARPSGKRTASASSSAGCGKGKGSSSARKRLSPGDDGGSGGGDDDDPRTPGRRLGLANDRLDEARKPLACPFYRQDPETWKDTSCMTFGSKRNREVIKHIFTVHSAPYCPKCLVKFPDLNLRNDHIRDVICANREVPRTPDFLTDEKRQVLARKEMLNISQEERWRRTFRTIFGEDEPVPCPYNGAFGDQFEDLKQYKDHLLAAVPEAVCASINSAIQEIDAIFRGIGGRYNIPDTELEPLLSALHKLPSSAVDGLSDSIATAYDEWYEQMSGSSPGSGSLSTRSPGRTENTGSMPTSSSGWSGNAHGVNLQHSPATPSPSAKKPRLAQHETGLEASDSAFIDGVGAEGRHDTTMSSVTQLDNSPLPSLPAIPHGRCDQDMMSDGVASGWVDPSKFGVHHSACDSNMPSVRPNDILVVPSLPAMQRTFDQDMSSSATVAQEWASFINYDEPHDAFDHGADLDGDQPLAAGDLWQDDMFPIEQLNDCMQQQPPPEPSLPNAADVGGVVDPLLYDPQHSMWYGQNS